MDSAQEAFARDLAIMVYNYLLEWRMKPLAVQFAATCPVLANVYQTPDHGMLSTIPYRRLHDAMWEHIELLDAMRRTIQLFHKEVPIPFGATSWEKIKVILDYFYQKSTAPPTEAGDGAKQATGTDANFVDNPATEPTSAGNAINSSEQSFNLSEIIQPVVLHTPSLEPEVQQHQPPEPCTNNANEPNTTGTPALVYLGRDGQPQLNTIFITMEGNGLQYAIQSDLMDLTQPEEIVHQPPDANDPAPEIANLNPEPTAPILPSLPMLEVDASMESGLTPPHPLLAEPEESQPEPKENQAEPEEIITASEEPETKSPPKSIEEAGKRSPATTCTKKHDAKAMATWNLMRGVSMADFDNHIRELNYQAELKGRKIAEQKKQKAVVKPAKSPTKTTTRKVSRTKKRKNKTVEKTDKLPSIKCAVTREQNTLDGSDSSDFVSSSNEDADVRKMLENVKQYRKRQKNEEKSPGQSSVLVSSSSEPVCRLNLITGRTPQNSTPKRNLRNRRPSSSTAKRTKQSPTISSDLTNVPTLDVTKQCTGGAKLAKQIQQPTEEAGPPPTPLSPANRRPIRACTVNRKRGIEQSYNKADVLSPELAKSCTMISDSFVDNPSAGTQDEAAIDAVLAKLHGEN